MYYSGSAPISIISPTTSVTRPRSLSPPRLRIEKLSEGQPLGEETAGVGLIFGETGNAIVVISLVPSGPAHRNGAICPGDVIAEVNGLNVESLPLKAVKQMIVGREGTNVTLYFKRSSTSKGVRVTLRREIPGGHHSHTSKPTSASNSMDFAANIPTYAEIATEKAINRSPPMSNRGDSNGRWSQREEQPVYQNQPEHGLQETIDDYDDKDLSSIGISNSPLKSVVGEQNNTVTSVALEEEIQHIRESILQQRTFIQLEQLQFDNQTLNKTVEKLESKLAAKKQKRKDAKRKGLELKAEVNHERILREKISQDLARAHEELHQLMNERRMRLQLEREVEIQQKALEEAITGQQEQLKHAEAEVIEHQKRCIILEAELIQLRAEYEQVLQGKTIAEELLQQQQQKYLDQIREALNEQEEMHMMHVKKALEEQRQQFQLQLQQHEEQGGYNGEYESPKRETVKEHDADVGILLSPHLRVIHLIRESPSFDCGLIQEGDFLVAVDEGSLPDAVTAVRRLRGPEHSQVHLSFQKADGRQYEATLIRRTERNKEQQQQQQSLSLTPGDRFVHREPNGDRDLFFA